jgi:uncharacterized protein YggU (UPF0235/DUF167 family)
VSALEWLVIIELVMLVALALFTGVAAFIARTHPDDAIVVFCRAFWMTFLYPPPDVAREGGFEVRTRQAREAREPVEPREPRTRPPRDGSRSKPPPTTTPRDDAFYGRVKPAADGVVHTATLNVVVLAHAEKDDVLGRTSDGIELQVTSAAEDSAANKSVIQLVSKALDVKPYQVTLTKGHYQTRKVVAITGMDQAQLDEKLAGIA